MLKKTTVEPANSKKRKEEETTPSDAVEVTAAQTSKRLKRGTEIESALEESK